MTRRFPDRTRTQTAAREIAAAARGRPGVVHKMLAAQTRERTVIVAEFVKVKGLMPLLMKHRNGDSWTRAERAQLQEQLRALAHLSPYLAILILPGSFALLPVFAWWLDRRRQRRDEAAASQ